MSVMESSDEADDLRGSISFPAGNDDFRKARNDCAKACRLFNETPEDSPPEVRVARWFDIVRQPTSNRSSEEQDAVTGEMTFRDPTLKPLAPFVKPPICMDYGLRVRIGSTTFINRYCMIMDTPVADVVIGERCSIGPYCLLVSVSHPLGEVERNTKRSSSGRQIKIGDGVWVGAGAIIMGGVTIGNGAVIGAGSLVTRDIPPNTLAYGVPAKLGKTLDGHEGSIVAGSVSTLEEALAVGDVPPADPTTSKGRDAFFNHLAGRFIDDRDSQSRRPRWPLGRKTGLTCSETMAAMALAISCLTCVLALAALLVATQ